MVWVFIGLSILAGCDPEALIKNKVPEPLRNALTFGKPSPGTQGRQPAATTAEIVMPRENGVYPVGKEMVF